MKFEISGAVVTSTPAMRHSVLLAAAATLFVSCGEPELSITVTETRPLTLHDQDYPGDLKDQPPVSWRRIPGTKFRIVNYLAGKDESVEIFLGESSGEVLGNANRWLGQFGLTPLQSQEFLGKTQMMDREAFIVEAQGTYVPGMGRPNQEKSALIGIIRPSGSNIITLKMIGPIEEVESMRDEFHQYVQSFTPVDVANLPDPKTP